MLRLMLLAVAFATVVMHHVVGAHQHGSGDLPAPHGAPVASAVSQHGAPHAPDASSAALHVHHAPSDDGGSSAHSLLHLCLAVLAAAAAAAVALSLIRLPADVVEHRVGLLRRVPRGDGAPPAPVPLRLAQLQILRL